LKAKLEVYTRLGFSLFQIREKGTKIMSSKDAYEKKMDAQLEQWQAEIDKLKAQSKEQSADAEIEYSKKMDELQAQKEATKSKLSEMKKSGEETWEDFKDRLEKSADDLSAGINAAKSRFS